MMNSLVKNGVLLLLLLWALLLLGQDKTTLEKQRKKLESDIQISKQQLEKIGADKKKSLTQLELLEDQIDSRQKVISTLNKELNIINSHVNELEMIVSSLEKDMTNLKKRYAEMVYFAYRNRSTMSDVVFLLSANNFNDAYKRLKYLQQYSQFRAKQAYLIIETKKDLSEKLAELQEKRAEQQKLLGVEVTQRKELDVEKKEKDQLVSDLKKKERQLLKDITKKKQQVSDLDKKIQAIIQKEIAAAKLKAEKEAKGNNTSTKSAPVADIKLSNLFADNKSKLPWPAEGYIASGFGQHAHPVLKSVVIDNKGIDIRCGGGEKVKSVFDGEVVSVLAIPGSDNCIIIKHGEYFTVYTRLQNVNVKAGDKVTTKQIIGTVNNEAELHFELWQGTVKLNPALWLYSR
ncbi:MAG: peptidoglycan DD-metalloendopeptidase family protein [Chitinophagales bacterium]|nr:peptidoglycan DD-metalloendopeptidase family protein [Chitinophagales bacterium]